MTILTIPAALAAYLAILYLLYIFAMLSRKLGAVTKMKPYYRWLYVALALVLLSSVCDWIVLSAPTVPEAASDLILSEWFYLVGHTVPLVAAAILALIIVLRYWGWLFREHDR
ncbi:hypothetical protein TFLX_00232 [Thermoflexales bacterium]|nr:hypothetical protein TFLX_00232 [Thermoflexales bacterium]